jgi:hypothetical protein
MEKGYGELASRRCSNHQRREAAALCPGCSRYFCRECITEHDDRVLCASCLGKTYKPPLLRRFRLGAAVRVFGALAGFLLLWASFYYLGQALLSLPSSFHEGTVWKSGWNDIEWTERN